MSQEFFKNTIESKFIKYLLSYTPLPIFPTISSDDWMIQGCIYIYKDKILKCTKTGTFNGIKANSFIDDHLYVQEDFLFVTDDDYVLAHWNPVTLNYDLYLPDEGRGDGYRGIPVPYEPNVYYKLERNEYILVTDPQAPSDWTTGAYFRRVWNGDNYSYTALSAGVGGLTVTDDVVRYFYRPVAEYEILDDFKFGLSKPNITQTFVSNTSYYDPQTHRFLGEYLRCLRDIYGVDLMGLYNCFDYDMTESFSLSEQGISELSNSTVNVLLVPIKFNKTYTIALDCTFPVYMKAVFFDKELLKDYDGTSFTDMLQDNVQKINVMQFGEPITFTVTNNTELNTQYSEDSPEYAALYQQKLQTDRTLQEHEKYLYLAIQVPKTNTSSVVVIEGDYSETSYKYTTSADGVNKLSDRQLSKTFKSKLSLLQANTQRQIAFSDKLIAYLLQYTIDSREELNENVARVETKIDYRPPIKDFFKGMWDVDLRYALYNNYMKIDKDYMSKLDIFGFVDRDIEYAVDKGMIKYGV